MRAYRLIGGQWSLVTDAVRTAMRDGEAYWVYCNGASDYQGPLSLQLPSGPVVDFSNTSDIWLNLANQSDDPLSIQVERTSGDDTLPLAYKILGVVSGGIGQVAVDLPSTYSLPTLESGASTSFWLSLRRDRMTSPVQTGLVRITTDVGVEYWLPVKGTRPDLGATLPVNATRPDLGARFPVKGTRSDLGAPQ